LIAFYHSDACRHQALIDVSIYPDDVEVPSFQRPSGPRPVQQFLEQAGFEVYLPQIRERRLLRGRRVQMLSPRSA
jgi:hypothetical protein